MSLDPHSTGWLCMSALADRSSGDHDSIFLKTKLPRSGSVLKKEVSTKPTATTVWGRKLVSTQSWVSAFILLSCQLDFSDLFLTCSVD